MVMNIFGYWRQRLRVKKLSQVIARWFVALAHWLVTPPPSSKQRDWLSFQADIIPAMGDARRLRVLPHPTFGLMAQGNFKSPSLNTDRYGFRVTMNKNHAVDIDEFRKFSGAKAVCSGNSVVFGMGASSDANTVASCLNNIFEEGPLWYNFATFGAPNLRQEREAVLTHMPLDIDAFVTVSGCIDIFLCMTGKRAGEGLFPSMGGATSNLLPQGPRVSLNPSSRAEDLEKLIALTTRELELFAQLWRGTNTKVLYMLQPIFPWSKKAVTHEKEQLLLDIFYGLPGDINSGYHADVVGAFHEPFAKAIEQACHNLSIDFIDLNCDPVISGQEWVFLDAVHLTDHAQGQIAKRIASWLGS
jgi:hypothetical protein